MAVLTPCAHGVVCRLRPFYEKGQSPDSGPNTAAVPGVSPIKRSLCRRAQSLCQPHPRRPGALRAEQGPSCLTEALTGGKRSHVLIRMIFTSLFHVPFTFLLPGFLS